MAKTHTPDAEMDMRVLTVYQMILNGHQRPEIAQYCAEQWHVKLRAADLYIHKANELIEQYVIEVKDKITKKSIARLERLMARAIKENNHTASLEIMKEYNKIFDIYPDPKMRHIFDGKVQVENKANLASLTEEDLKNLAAELAAKTAAKE